MHSSKINFHKDFQSTNFSNLLLNHYVHVILLQVTVIHYRVKDILSEMKENERLKVIGRFYLSINLKTIPFHIHNEIKINF
jgi:hypothetical protein